MQEHDSAQRFAGSPIVLTLNHHTEVHRVYRAGYSPGSTPSVPDETHKPMEQSLE
jgi:hypothetical protein